MNDDKVQTPHTWAELLEWRKDFPAIVHRWLKVIDRLIVHTKIRDDDELGDLIVGFMVSAYWYGPRKGTSQSIGEFEKVAFRDFTAPSSGPGNDWVLILDDASKAYPEPGKSLGSLR